MADDAEHIQGLIRRWAEAVHAGDLDAVVAHEHHAFPLKGDGGA
jgi:ketosteroid isomerase-like protein